MRPEFMDDQHSNGFQCIYTRTAMVPVVQVYAYLLVLL